MDDRSKGADITRGSDFSSIAQNYKRDFWSKENLKFAAPHFRLEKAVRLINKVAKGRECDLLDVCCGPAALMHWLPENIHYYGIDIAIHDSQAPNHLEADFMEAPIEFGGNRFDIVLAQGVFEYVGALQAQKFAEIGGLLKPGGTFIVSYWNFTHVNKHIYEAFSNVQPIDDFRKSLAQYFTIDKYFPVAHNWHHREPGRKLIMAAQMHVNLNIPFVSPALAVEYFFVCSPSKNPDL